MVNYLPRVYISSCNVHIRVESHQPFYISSLNVQHRWSSLRNLHRRHLTLIKKTEFKDPYLLPLDLIDVKKTRLPISVHSIERLSKEID